MFSNPDLVSGTILDHGIQVDILVSPLSRLCLPPSEADPVSVPPALDFYQYIHCKFTPITLNPRITSLTLQQAVFL